VIIGRFVKESKLKGTLFDLINMLSDSTIKKKGVKINIEIYKNISTK
jgi:hypothetical protein